MLVEVPLSIQTYPCNGSIARLVKRKSITLTRIMITIMNFQSWLTIIPLSYSGLLLKSQYILGRWRESGWVAVWEFNSEWLDRVSRRGCEPEDSHFLKQYHIIRLTTENNNGKPLSVWPFYILSREVVTERLNSSRR